MILLFSFVPLFFVEDDIQNQQEPALSVLPYSFLFFFLWNLIVCWWMARIHFIGGMSVIILNSVLMCVVFLLFSWVKRSTGGGPLIFAILWIGFEFLHYKGDLSWPWLSLGNGLAGNIRIIQWYEFTGTTGGSLWVLCVNIMLFKVLKSFIKQGPVMTNYLRTILTVCVIIAPVAISHRILNSYIEEDKATGFLILQPGLDPYDDKYTSVSNSDRLDHLLILAENNIRKETRYIVSPETSVDSIWITNPADTLSMKILKFLDQYPGTGMVLGATTFSSVSPEEKSVTTRIDQQGNLFDIYNSALLYFDNSINNVYHKHYLANGVEQIPFQRIFRFLGRLSLDLGGVSGSLKRGKGQKVFRKPGSEYATLGILICFESAYGEYAARMVRDGAEVLLVISNDGWFKNTGAYKQHLKLSQIRAVETRRSVVRAANTGVSCSISQTGEITDQLDWWKEGALPVCANKNDRITFFSLYGDYPGRVALVFSILMVLNSLVRVRLN